MAKLKSKLLEIAGTVAFFGAWIGTLVLLKTLVLQEYRIGFVGWSKVLVGALLLAKIVRWLDHIRLGGWFRARPAWVAVVVRTALYSAGLVVAMLLDAGFEGREEHGGFLAALDARRETASFPHLLVNSICLTGAFLIYNILFVLRSHLGGDLFRLFLKPLPENPDKK
ncbi:MAG: hypothetical protein HC814_05175 [Rhodobacteraceae bacterium]|nr:hypothetical protein [Paracoccaceae bacterium]